MMEFLVIIIIVAFTLYFVVEDYLKAREKVKEYEMRHQKKEIKQ